MARSFTNVNFVSSLLLQGFANALTRRGYAVASQNATRGGVVSMNKIGTPTSGEDKGVSPYKVSWVPDPVTGYYKPENINEVDVAELRATLLVKKMKSSSKANGKQLVFYEVEEACVTSMFQMKPIVEGFGRFHFVVDSGLDCGGNE
ncbi:unnamed protein product [Sphenostylis stenocarpa]|uniref:Uncharacterized protein n=1 Tax=Sphenostylis stenocarpa TaxID=92480 RepID=A0AA86RPV0_9FABA|nr:unnamed protein product [Sphenostylis stenocarpa]